MTEKMKRTHHVYTLLVEVGRKEGDGLPDAATGGALMIYASGVDHQCAACGLIGQAVAFFASHFDKQSIDIMGALDFFSHGPGALLPCWLPCPFCKWPRACRGHSYHGFNRARAH